MQSLAGPFPRPERAVSGPPGASPIAYPLPRGEGGQVSLVTQPVQLLPDGPHARQPADDANVLVMGTSTAALTQVVIRAPGEHRHGDRSAHAEVQLRFTASAGAMVVMSLPIIRGPEHPAVTELIAGTLDIRALILRPKRFAAYHGSDTIPPFQRPVMWLVATTALTARTAQLAELVQGTPKALPPRALQPNDGRPVVNLRAKVVALRQQPPGRRADSMG